MHLRSLLLSRPSSNSPFDNRTHPMANISQALDLEGIIHCEMHGLAEQIRVKNEINARLVQHLATTILPPPTAPIPKRADRSYCSHQAGDQDSQSCHSIGRDIQLEAVNTNRRSKADKYFTAEELAEAKRRRRGRDHHKRKELDTQQSDYKAEVKSKRVGQDERERINEHRPRTLPSWLDLVLPPLKTLIA
ncbi:hypothetical protein Acr_07g0014410 [Actinidia rufa]|uniref:Uncharacterized protein n=1 Tax=Actinidia rufa TaxID=165716 RepID=A0A7J0EXT0_9ERIC|nr:hypothetical protein Acr_07g0014410 [Actinidia rufa]